MNSNTNPIEALPPLFYTHNNTLSDNITEAQNIQKRNAVIDEFLNSLDNKNNLNYSNVSKNNENSDNEEDEMDEFFEGLKYLKKESKPNSNDILKQKMKRPKFNERKITSMYLSNKNNIKNNLNIKSNSHKYSAFSFDDNSNSNNHIEKIPTLECINTNNINSNFSQKQFNTYITDYGSKINKKLPKIKKNLKLRNCNTKNYFLNSLKSTINNNEHNIIYTEEKNKNSKWTNRKLLNNIDLYFSNNPPSLKYLFNLNQRSKSHIGNRVYKNNLNTMNKEVNKEVNKEIFNLSPNYIAAQLYKNNSYFKKGLKRNYTAKINDTIFNTNLNENAKENIIFSERQNKKNKKIFNEINNNMNFNNIKKQYKRKNSFRKIFNERNAKYGMNWINTVINKKLNENLNNKNDLSKKQLKLKLTQLGFNCNLKNDDKFFMNDKNYLNI